MSDELPITDKLIESLKSRRIKVLVVEDSDGDLDLHKHVLESMRCDVVEARSGEQVRGALSPDIRLAIVDLKLPGMSGLEVLDMLRTSRPDMHLIVLTGGAMDSPDVVDAVKRGYMGILRKPLTVEGLEDILRKHNL